MTEEELVFHEFLCPYCKAEAQMKAPPSREIKLPQKCLFCGHEMFYVPAGRMWDVKYHLEALCKALTPAEEEKEGGEE